MPDPDQHPVEILWRLQQEAMGAGNSLPQEQQGAPKWGGLAFGVGNLRLVTELTSISDVLDCPSITPVPRTRPWIMGICNVRGKLYSVVDLGSFLGVAPVGAARDGKLLVVNNENLGCTIFVPKIFGLRYFTEDQVAQDNSGLDKAVLPYAERSYVQGDHTWRVISLERLVSAERFLNVGC